MKKNVIQKVVFKRTTPKVLYDLYVNAKQHSLITGSPVKISSKEGEEFSAHGGYITGRTIKSIKDSLIVQAWRSLNWDKTDDDSILIIMLEPKGEDVTLHLIHTNIPEGKEADIDKGWFGHYWNPWKQYLSGKPITRPAM